MHPPNQEIKIVKASGTAPGNAGSLFTRNSCNEFIQCPRIIDATHEPKESLVSHAMNIPSGGAKGISLSIKKCLSIILFGQTIVF